MHVYKIKPGGFAELKRKLLFISIPLILILLAVLYATVVLNSNGNNYLAIFVSAPIIFIIVLMGILKGINSQKNAIESLTFSITHQSVMLEQLNLAPVSIQFEDIQRIYKKSSGAICIKGKNLKDFIKIPTQFEKFNQIERKLSEIRQFEK